ncbi:hypothetical protein BD408DRAFT_444476 [Parasitella parasitica]|nr:hypothetical protein BD408DRAFT_444476 [Parasitella parasitica]
MAQSFDKNKHRISRTQDTLGYMDTSLIRQRQPKREKIPRVPISSNFAYVTNSNILPVEPTPTRPMRLAVDNRKRSSTTLAKPENAPESSSHSATQPPTKSNAADATALNTALNTLQPTDQHQDPPLESRSNSLNNKGKEREHPPAAEQAPAASTSAEAPAQYAANSNDQGPRAPPQTSQERDEFKDMFVTKFLELKELAEMLHYIEGSSPQSVYTQSRSFEQAPRPTPSHSDPNTHSQLRKKPSRGKLNGYVYPSPENNRKTHNKSADMATNYGEPNKRHSSSSSSRRNIYSKSREYPLDHHDGRTPYDANVYYGHSYAQQIPYYYSLYKDYYLPPSEEAFLDHGDYYVAHHSLHRARQPTYYDDDIRPRRKSSSNMHEEQQYRLKKKGSRGSMRKSKVGQQQQQQQHSFYEYPDVTPPHPPHHHHYQYSYGHPAYYQNQQYAPNGGG